jgi:hypothetical protein
MKPKILTVELHARGIPENKKLYIAYQLRLSSKYFFPVKRQYCFEVSAKEDL